jgi:parvulin-like peptidyl-prolyl isomerase
MPFFLLERNGGFGYNGTEFGCRSVSSELSADTPPILEKDVLNMGASQEKKKRQEMKSSGIDRRQERNEKLEKEKRRSRRKNTIVGSIVAVVLIAVILINSNLFYTGLTALTIGDKQYTVADFNYYYYSTYHNMYSSLYQYYGESISQLLDSRRPLKDQMYDETRSWADYFEEVALSNMREVTLLCDAAEKAGLTLKQEDIDSIDQSMEDIKNNYSSYGYSSLSGFFAGVYGRGVNEKNYRKNLENDHLANLYVKNLIENMEYTDAELSEYYNEHRDQYDLLTYRRYYVSGLADEENGIDSEAAMAAAKEIAEAIGAAKNEQEFNDLVYQYAPEDKKETYADGAGTIYSNQSPSSIIEDHAKWLLEDDRAEGDVTVIESSSGYYVLCFLSRNDNSYNTVNVRHILIPIEDTSDETSEEMAKEKAEMLYKVWQSGDATEDSFAELAKANSSDGSASNGGLYEKVRLGQMVKEFEDWCFAKGRKPGDTGIVKTQYGYHIMYFSGESKPYRLLVARSAMESENYSQWLEEQKQNYEISKKFSMRFAG